MANRSYRKLGVVCAKGDPLQIPILE